MTIKKFPEDFQVDEVLDPAFLSAQCSPAVKISHRHPLYRLEKEGLATPEAVGMIANKWDLQRTAISHAGLKDKHAKCSQYISIKIDEKPSKLPERDSGPGWSVERAGYLREPITSQAILSNKFTLTLRNLAPEDCNDLDEAAHILTIPGETPALRVVNYFGDQRFGSARHGHGFLAKQLIKGEFEEALKLAIAVTARKDRQNVKMFKRTLSAAWGNWKQALPRLPHCPERKAIEHLEQRPHDFRGAFCTLPYFFQQLCVYAYQSHLWNATARKLIAAKCGDAGPVLAAHDDYGEMLFPAAESTPPELADLEIPVLGYKTELTGVWKEAAEAVLKDEAIETANLKIPGVRRPFFGEVQRTLFMKASNFNMQKPVREGAASDRLKRAISFELPRGCYATVVLRALGQ